MAIECGDRVKEILVPMLIGRYGHRGLDANRATMIGRAATEMVAKGEKLDGLVLDPSRPVDIQYADFIGMKAVSLRA
jgi:hypothetical protein